MKTPTVALVGRPNVGKSTVFNRLVGKKISIIEDTPGVTRDRIYGDVIYKNYKFHLIDTGGIDVGPENFNKEITIQDFSKINAEYFIEDIFIAFDNINLIPFLKFNIIPKERAQIRECFNFFEINRIFNFEMNGFFPFLSVEKSKFIYKLMELHIML